MGKRGRRESLPSPEDVLAGRVEARAADLFALVHDVNPTGEESPRERELYALKSRLQGLLVTRFPDEIEVVPDGLNPDLVSLRHRSGLRDACHALLSQLPAEARALLRRRLDEARSEAGQETDEGADRTKAARDSGPPLRIGSGGGDEAHSGTLLARGREAVEAYDYEEAQRLLTAALERGAGIPAARELLELLVDFLADDEGALALETRLTRPEAADFSVRALLGTAAARSGAAEHALKLVRGLEGPRVAAVHAALARQALDAGDPEGAAARLEEARRFDPAEPSLRELEGELAARRQKERSPAEEALLELLGAGDRDAAEAAARDVVRRWPDSGTGRRVLREIEATRRTERAQALERDGREALDRGDPARAARLFSQAVAEGAGSPALDGLLERAHAEVERRGADASVKTASEALAGTNRLGALVRYAELSPALRSRVRADSAEHLLAILDEVLAAAPDPRPRPSAEAAFAVAAAGAALARGDARAPLEALEALGPHEKVLSRVPRASTLLAEAEKRLFAQRNARAREALDRATAAFDAGNLDGAAEALRAVPKSDLDAEGREDLAQLKGRFLEEEGREKARREANARAEEQRACKVAISSEPYPADELADSSSVVGVEKARPSLSADGRELVVADVFDQWLFLRVVDVPRSQVVRRLSLLTPRPLGGFPSVLVEGRKVTVMGDEGRFVSVDLESGTLIRSGSVARSLPDHTRLEGVELVPGSDTAWLEVTLGQERRPAVFAVDLAHSKVLRRIHHRWSLDVVYRGEDSVLVLEDDGLVEISTPAGLATSGALPLLPCHVHVVAPASVGPGILVAGPPADAFFPEDDVEEGNSALNVLELKMDGSWEVGVRVTLPGTYGDSHTALATAREDGASFVLNTPADETLVFTLGPDLTASAAVPPSVAPRETALFVDAASRHAVAGCWWGERFAVVPLGRTTLWPAWDGPLEARVPHVSIPSLQESYGCGFSARASKAQALAVYAQLVDVPEGRLAHEVGKLIQTERTGDDLTALAGALDRLGRTWHLRKRVEEGLLRRFPEHPDAVLLRARKAADAGDWEAVQEITRGALSGIASEGPQHLRHLHAIALARAGHCQAALRVLEQALESGGGDCELGPLVRFLREFVADEPSASPAGRLLQLLRSGACALAAGEPLRAIEHLDRGLIWAAEVLQGHALLARAWLETEAATPRDLFRKRRALARLLDLLGQPARFRRDLPPLTGGLDEKAVAEVAERARAFLLLETSARI